MEGAALFMSWQRKKDEFSSFFKGTTTPSIEGHNQRQRKKRGRIACTRREEEKKDSEPVKNERGIKQHEFTRKMRVLREEQNKGERLEGWKEI